MPAPSMRVLHLPFNIASQITTTVRALRDIGVAARGLARSGVITSNEYVETFPPRPKGIAGVWSPLDRYYRTLSMVAWADVVHWHYGWALHGELDLRYAQMLGRKLCVEYWGSDIRVDEVEAADNIYFARTVGEQHASLQAVRALMDRNRERSEFLQRTFAEAGARVILPCPSLAPHLIGRSRDSYFTTRQRVYLQDFTPRYPDPARPKPVILHAPSSQRIKGTRYVQAAITELEGRGLQFEYRQIENMPHAQALELMADCDIYVDQLILGSHGIAALEAMAFGKAAVCYIKPSMQGQYPPELPIVSASPDTLANVLAELLADRARIADLGRRGRAYVEQYHDAVKLARGILAFYESL
jgi:glycosyltransferase involved in cell wall biosynthesis